MPDWYVVNVADAPWFENERGGAECFLERRDVPFDEIGINIRVVRPGQPAAAYHSEQLQEDFLVLSGECLLIVEGEERRLRAWDFVHCPPGTLHTFVGAGDGPCAILMIGARGENRNLHYPPNDLAAKFGASSPEDTYDPRVAYREWPQEFTPASVDWPPAG